MKWNINHKYPQELLIHLFVWVFLFGLPPMLIGHTNERLDEEEIFRMMGNPIAMTLVFYINYIWLVPRLVFNKKNKIYVLLNVILCAGMLFFTHFWFRLGNVSISTFPFPHLQTTACGCGHSCHSESGISSCSA
ncbi:hypothetical protein [Paraprevotella xylaniphila]|uniref:hypothetical protein n=1 Tax=Paraprevotella xylaniphila TaxID=454155 RepID=UPI003077C0F8